MAVLARIAVCLFIMVATVIGDGTLCSSSACTAEDKVELFQKRVVLQPVFNNSESSKSSESEADNARALIHERITTFYGHSAVFLRRASQLQVIGRITLDSPAAAHASYDLTHAQWTFFSQWRQDQLLWPKVLQPITQYYLSRQAQADAAQQQRPFFVESGARNGEKHSNTLFLEREYGWNGLLIEPSQKEYPKLRQRKRKCYSWQGCLSPTGLSEDLHFVDSGDGVSHIDEQGSVVKAESLLSLLQAMSNGTTSHTVDFWSLDIEGSEPPVLETTDFNSIEVGVLMIEMNKGEDNNGRIRSVMEANKFVEIGGTRYNKPGALDYVFVNPMYFEARGIAVPKEVDGLLPPHQK